MLLSSDMPGSDFDFFYMLHAAVSRRDRKLQPTGGWFPEERLTPEEAVRGYTRWPAFASFTDRDAGQLKNGFRGDVTILDRDPFVIGTGDADKLLGGKALATVVRGRVVYERAQK
jgi:predicted amidohydrolase YtcJ